MSELRRRITFLLGPLLCAARCEAGMPSADLVLTELGARRVEELSFFLMLFFATSFCVQRLWNFIQMDFPNWPRLTYRRAVAMTLLWGLASIVVLTMISGARELMTPAAWEPKGVTYKVKEDEPAKKERETVRRSRLEQLRDRFGGNRFYCHTFVILSSLALYGFATGPI